jgi:hypothetical protein
MLGAGWGKLPFLFSLRKQVLELYWNTHRHLWEDGMMTRASCLQVCFPMNPHGLSRAQLLWTCGIGVLCYFTKKRICCNSYIFIHGYFSNTR